jgi:hypothetical protein
MDYFEATHAALAARGELPVITDAAFRDQFLAEAQKAGITDSSIWIQGQRQGGQWFGLHGVPLPYLDFYDGYDPTATRATPALTLITDFAKVQAMRRKMRADRSDLRQQFAYIVWDE